MRTIKIKKTPVGISIKDWNHAHWLLVKAIGFEGYWCPQINTNKDNLCIFEDERDFLDRMYGNNVIIGKDADKIIFENYQIVYE